MSQGAVFRAGAGGEKCLARNRPCSTQGISCLSAMIELCRTMYFVGMDSVDMTFSTHRRTRSTCRSFSKPRRQRQRRGKATVSQPLPSLFICCGIYTWYIMCRHPIPHAAVTKSSRCTSIVPSPLEYKGSSRVSSLSRTLPCGAHRLRSRTA